KAMLDPYNPAVVTDYVQFITTKTHLLATDPRKCHVNYVVGDSGWEIAFAEILERHPATLAYVKNQALGFEVPYLDKSEQLEAGINAADGATVRSELFDPSTGEIRSDGKEGIAAWFID